MPSGPDCGGVPVFADVCPDTLTLDPDAAEARITGRTKALLPVDFAGQPCDADRFDAVARARGLCVIQDSAHSLGGEYRGRRVGSLADLTTFSFHAAKLVTAGEGGAVTTSRDDLAARLRRFRNHGFDTDFRERQARGEVYSPMPQVIEQPAPNEFVRRVAGAEDGQGAAEQGTRLPRAPAEQR